VTLLTLVRQFIKYSTHMTGFTIQQAMLTIKYKTRYCMVKRFDFDNIRSGRDGFCKQRSRKYTEEKK